MIEINLTDTISLPFQLPGAHLFWQTQRKQKVLQQIKPTKKISAENDTIKFKHFGEGDISLSWCV